MRLIDADAFKDYIDCGHLRPPTEVCFSEWDVCDMIDKRPTIDAIEVVRCRECEYWKCNPNTKNYGVCRKVSYDDFEVVMEKDDFCSYGERKEDSET